MKLNCRFVLVLPWILMLGVAPSPSAAGKGPWVMRVSCGAFLNVYTAPTNTFWHKDFSYTGGVPFNATRPSMLTPPLKTLRYFPLSSGPNNCYNIRRVPRGHYSVRIFFGLVAQEDFNIEPLFDVSIEGTQIYSLESGWSSRDEESFVEAQVFLLDRTASICFHSTGHGDPAIISLEILQIDDHAYYLGHAQGSILRTAYRLNCAAGKPMFGVDLNANHWSGDRFWSNKLTFGLGADRVISTERTINLTSEAPNFYPQALYQNALLGTDSQADLSYTMDVKPNRNYSLWLHFAEIDESITEPGQRVFDILINGDTVLRDVDIVKMAGGPYKALVINTTVAVEGRSLTISLTPASGSRALINAIEVFEIIPPESRTSILEVRMMEKLKSALGLPPRFGWNGDPCVPQQHPWSGVDCQLDKTIGEWFIDGLALDNQGLGGFLPKDLSRLSRLVNVNLSGNAIRGSIPPSIGNITSLEVLDLSYNNFNGSIPENLGHLTALRLLNLNGNSLFGRVPAALGGRLLHGATFNFTDNSGLCGIPGLPSCGRLSVGAKAGIAVSAVAALLFAALCVVVWRKRRQNILRAQIAARGAPYAKARTNAGHEIQLSRNHNSRTASESGPILLS